MEDLRVLKHARHYILSMAQGINPLNGEFAPDGDTISQERIQKCCDYVAGLIEKIIENNGEIGKKAINKKEFSITPQQISRVNISEIPIGINELAKRINATCEKNMKGISGVKIASWLADNGYLDIETSEETVQVTSVKTKKVLNERSKEIGITVSQGVKRTTGEVYEKLLYSAEAQRFILRNLANIINKQS